jgi:ribosome-associated heat shock protein Hsp15
MLEIVCMRIDKWLWAARFFRTRSLAQTQLENSRVSVNGQAAKPSREVLVGDMVAIKCKDIRITVKVLAVSDQRGPAPVAQALYEETSQSQAERAVAREAARAQWAAQGSDAQRPTKRDRRERDAYERRDPEPGEHSWGDRWSADAGALRR